MKYAVLLLFAFLALPLFAHADDAVQQNTLVLVRETNERVLSLQNKANETAIGLKGLSERVSGTDYSVNGFIGKFNYALIVFAAFSACLSAFLTYWFVARPLRKALAQVGEILQSRPSQGEQRPIPALNPDTPTKKDTIVEYETLEAWVCPKDGVEYIASVKFCPEHGKKIILKKTRVPKVKMETEVRPSWDEAASGYAKLPPAYKRPWYKFW